MIFTMMAFNKAIRTFQIKDPIRKKKRRLIGLCKAKDSHPPAQDKKTIVRLRRLTILHLISPRVLVN